MLITAAVVAQLPAQQPGKGKAPQPDKTYTSASEIAAMMAKAKNERKQDQANFIQSILRLAPYSANLEYRGAVGPASVHEKEAELFYVIDGSGTLVTGGKLVGETRTNPDNLSGTAIEGGNTAARRQGRFLHRSGEHPALVQPDQRDPGPDVAARARGPPRTEFGTLNRCPRRGI